MGAMVRIMRKSKVGAVVVSVFDWYPSEYPPEERKLLRKLDLAILIYGSLSFFCRFLGQQNITNAYVSGMKEDLKAYGNELNYYGMTYDAAYVLGQIPLMALQTKARIAPFLLPTLQISWAVVAFCQSTVTRNWHLYVLRAITGFLEASSFGGTHLIRIASRATSGNNADLSQVGSWFKNEELFKRAGVWFMGNSLGSMFSGYLQAALYKNLDGAAGRAGWRWLFLIQGVITLPIAFIGYVFWPGLPTSPRRWYLSSEEHSLAVKRIPTVEKEGITWDTFRYTLKRPMFWICVPCYICLVQAGHWITYMALWLKARGDLSVELVNILPTFVNLVSALSSWLGTTLAGCLSVRGLFTFQFVFMFTACIVLTIWHVPDGAKYFAFYAGGIHSMASPILYSWVNYTLKENYGERGLIISSMMTLGFGMKIWLPLLTFPKVKAPRFPKGYPSSIAFEFIMWSILIGGSLYMERWKILHPDFETRLAEETQSSSDVVSVMSSAEKNRTQEHVRGQVNCRDLEESSAFQSSEGTVNGGRGVK